MPDLKSTLSQQAAILQETTISDGVALSDMHHTHHAQDSGVTFRVVLLSLLLAALFGYVIPIIDFKLNNTYLGGTHFPVGAIAVLLCLLLLTNPLLKLLSLRWVFSRNETLTVYITCLFSCLVPGRGAENFFIPNVIASFYLATGENGWLKVLQPYLKPWMTPALTVDNQYHQKVVEGWYVGGGTEIPWAAWAVPFIAWASLVIAVYIMLGCLGVILRAQWAEREALAFPLLRLPLEMTENEGVLSDKVIGRFFHNPLMWVGFGIAALIQAINGLNSYFPDVPRIPLQIGGNSVFSAPPWNQLYPTTFTLWPVVFGLSYLLTTEVAFSLWFFYWFAKVQIILAYYLGFQPEAMPTPIWTRGWAKNFIAYQQVGAYIAYLAILVWIGREHYLYVVRRAFGRIPPQASEKQEALSYPTAFWGFLLSFVFIVVWTTAAGVRLDIALALWLTYLMLAFILTRVVVEGGLVFAQSGWAPVGPIAHLMGGGTGSWLIPASAVPAAFIQGAFMTDMRAFLLPSFVQGFKLAHDRKIAMKPLLALIAVCILIAMSISWWNILRLGYTDVGGLQLENWWSRGNGATQPVQNAKEIIDGVQDSFLVNWFWLGIGGLMTYGMMWARSRYLWFPLHPLGLIMCWPTAMYSMWFSIFSGWLCKVLIMKYSGSDAYRRITPLFLGLALGDIALMIFWLIIDCWQGKTGHLLIPQ